MPSAVTTPLCEIESFENEAALEEALSRPTPELIADFKQLQGDLLILGVGGKMGPTLARMAKRAIDEAELSHKVIGVSRFSNPKHKADLEALGIETHTADLLEPEQVRALPETPEVIFMPGLKFGSDGAQCQTWAANAYLPGNLFERFHNSRFVVFSSGNVYAPSNPEEGGTTEDQDTGPIGEYAQSVLARERIFEYFSRKFDIPQTLYRLFYATEMRYGVLVDLALSINEGKPIDLTNGHANVIWQGDANAQALRCLFTAKSPPEIFNITGPQFAIKEAALALGEHLGKTPTFANEPGNQAFLGNAQKSWDAFGHPSVSLETLISWTARWIKDNGATLGKPTHFATQNGKY